MPLRIERMFDSVTERREMQTVARCGRAIPAHLGTAFELGDPPGSTGRCAASRTAVAYTIWSAITKIRSPTAA
jgi:hypothetical protein